MNAVSLHCTVRGLLLSLLFPFALTVSAQQNVIYNPRIASLQVVAGEDWLSPPVINLDEASSLSGRNIEIDFDDKTHDYHRYVYKLEHCEADWSVSDGLFESNYVDGFASGNTIDEDVSESVNTNVLYTHYHLSIPNDRCRIKISGNYRLTVYDDNQDNEPVFSACFMVVEPVMTLSLGATTNTDLGINSRYQQISMSLNYGGLRVTAPATQIKTIVMQNGRWDNAVKNSQPQFILQDGLRWEHNRDLIFHGGNEYRKFEMLDVSHTTMGLEHVNWDGKHYHAWLWPDEPRPSYVYDESANGSFYIRNSDNRENNVTSEYVMVHFQLNSPPVNGTVYLNGTWTNGQLIPEYQMHYDEVAHNYKATVQLKQGYYSYQYLILKDDGTTAFVPSEGDFFQTENQYQGLVYYRGPGDRTDRLVAYQEIQLK